MPTELTYVCSRPECRVKSADPAGWFVLEIEPTGLKPIERVVTLHLVDFISEIQEEASLIGAFNDDTVKLACGMECAPRVFSGLLSEHFNGNASDA